MNDHERPPPILVGGPLRDAADPTHGVQRDRCVVCATERDLTRTHLDGPAGVICHRHYDAAMCRLGSPRPTSVRICTRCPSDDPARFGVTAVWPLGAHQQGQPVIYACRRHLAESIAALVSDRT